jgi:hypothetical protein
VSEQQSFLEPAAPAASLSWSEVWQRALLQPTVESYETLIRDPKANASRGYTWMAVCGVISYALSALLGLALGAAQVDTVSVTQLAGEGVTTLLCGVPAAALGGIIGVAISAGISHLIARALGGTGTYDKLAYAVAAYQAPLMLISSVLSAVPYLCFLSYALSAYAIVLNVIAVKAVHRFGWGQAIVSSVIVLVALIACIAVVAVAILVLLGPVIGDVFSNIVREI